MGIWELIMKILENLERFQALAVAVPLIWGLAKWVKAKAHELSEAKEAGLWEAAQYLWREGQALKRRLDATDGRGDFQPQLREKAFAALRIFNLPEDQIERILEVARVIHKMTKTDKPKEARAEGKVLPPVVPSPGSEPTSLDLEPLASSPPEPSLMELGAT